MRRRPRFRRIAKWTGLVLCALTLAVWGVALRYSAGVPIGERGFISLRLGLLELGVRDGFRANVPEPWTAKHEFVGVGLARPGIETAPERGLVVFFVPYWILLLTILIPTTVLFYRDRIIPAGNCAQCRYNLTGNKSGICPECGAKIGVSGKPANTETT